MTAQIVAIDDFRIKRERGRVLDGCQHKQLTLDDEGGIVMCDDCGRQVDNYVALSLLVERWWRLQERAERRAREIAAAEAKTVGLRAAQRVEQAWRSRTMVPTCPHCSEAIFADDGFGSSMANRELALRRRRVTEQGGVEPSSGDGQTRGT